MYHYTTGTTYRHVCAEFEQSGTQDVSLHLGTTYRHVCAEFEQSGTQDVSLHLGTTYRHVCAEFEQSGTQDRRSEEAEEYEPAHNLVPDFLRFCNTKSRV